MSKPEPNYLPLHGRGFIQKTYHPFHPEDVLDDGECPYCKCPSILDCICIIPTRCTNCHNGVHLLQNYRTGEIAILCTYSYRSPANCDTPICYDCEKVKCICCETCGSTYDDHILCTGCGSCKCTCNTCKMCRFEIDSPHCNCCQGCYFGKEWCRCNVADTTETSKIVLCNDCCCSILDCACTTGIYHVFTKTICEYCSQNLSTCLCCANCGDHLDHKNYCTSCETYNYCNHCMRYCCICCYSCGGLESIHDDERTCKCCKECGYEKQYCYCAFCRNCDRLKKNCRCEYKQYLQKQRQFEIDCINDYIDPRYYRCEDCLSPDCRNTC